MNIEILENDRIGQYEEFLSRRRKSLFYASNKYRQYLKYILGAEDKYLLAIDDQNSIVGALPGFVSREGGNSKVMNSLPFFGSIGGVISESGDDRVYASLLKGFKELARSQGCAAATIITSFFEDRIDLYEDLLQFSYTDVRIGQVKRLPEKGSEVENALMRSIDPVRRRNIRKAVKSGITWDHEGSFGAVEFLYRTHVENMNAIGGKTKPEKFFRHLGDYFEYGEDYRIYMARADGEPVAALLVFYFNETVEYFVPAVKSEFRQCQPLSLIIFEAMRDAAQRGYSWWNWGGTWLSQDGVYNFKKRWGTEEFRYYYYTMSFDQEGALFRKTPEELGQQYPNFYVLPYGELEKASE